MIKIKCTTEEKERLLLVLSKRDLVCPFEGLCTDLPNYHTGMSCGDCIANNIKWEITDAPVKEKSVTTESGTTLTFEKFAELSTETAIEFYEPFEHPERILEFLSFAPAAALLATKIFKEEQ